MAKAVHTQSPETTQETPGLTVSGIVLDENDEPTFNAEVEAYWDTNSKSTHTDKEGRFQFCFSLHLNNDSETQTKQDLPDELTFRPGGQVAGLTLVWVYNRIHLAGYVTDEDSNPIENAGVSSFFDRAYLPENQKNVSVLQATTNAKGYYNIIGFPDVEGIEVNLQLWHSDYVSTRRYGVPLNGQEQDLVLIKKPLIEGRVTNVETGEPITTFRLDHKIGREQSPLYSNESFLRNMRRTILNNHPNGVFTFRANGYNFVQIGISAPGYLSAIHNVPGITPGTTIQNVEVCLQPTPAITGVVLDSSGAPIPSVGIYLGHPRLIKSDE